MLPVHRVTDLNTGHPCFPPIDLADNGITVYANNLRVGRVTDPYNPHCCNAVCHVGAIQSGSGSTYAENLALARQGDPVDCSNVCFADFHSPDVFENG